MITIAEIQWVVDDQNGYWLADLYHHHGSQSRFGRYSLAALVTELHLTGVFAPEARIQLRGPAAEIMGVLAKGAK